MKRRRYWLPELCVDVIDLINMRDMFAGLGKEEVVERSVLSHDTIGKWL